MEQMNPWPVFELRFLQSVLGEEAADTQAALQSRVSIRGWGGVGADHFQNQPSEKPVSPPGPQQMGGSTH